MTESLNLTIVYEDDEDGWIIASIPEVRGVHSQGRTREEARVNVLSAMNDWLRWYLEDQQGAPGEKPPKDADTDSVQLVFSA